MRELAVWHPNWAPISRASATPRDDLIAYYASYLVALLVALALAATFRELTAWVLLPAAVFALSALLITAGLLVLAFRGYGALPGWLQRRPMLGALMDDIAAMPRALFHNVRLFAACFCFEFAILLLDAGTLWTLLHALGEPSPRRSCSLPSCWPPWREPSASYRAASARSKECA